MMNNFINNLRFEYKPYCNSKATEKKTNELLVKRFGQNYYTFFIF